MELKLQCPLCSVVATGDHRLRKHLTGTPEYYGHSLDPEKAREYTREAIRQALQKRNSTGRSS